MATLIPGDYVERVYAGVLGKIIGVYLGRPVEGWTYEKIQERLGEVSYYVNDQLGLPLVVTDDDISGTFTYIRALPDHGNTADITPAQIGWTWLNYIVENKAILWWGGMGVSTEHTAFLRLKSGIDAPMSGSIELNGQTVAEQIGAQIFIDGWGMVCPGDPELAADLARKAASVSHDGEAIYAAQVVAAMEAMAFVDQDIDRLMDMATSLIPSDSTIYAVINDVREWCSGEPDWRRVFRRIQGKYGYDKFRGACHMVPNHAVVIMGMLYGRDDFQNALMVTNTAGWDTDCNSANVGCLTGIRLGLDCMDVGVDWRGPVADRLFLPTADGGRTVSDAVRETYELVNTGLRLKGQAPLSPKAGARYHFSLPGSVQGFGSDEADSEAGVVTPVESPFEPDERLLQVRAAAGEGKTVRATTATFLTEEALKLKGYGLLACPQLYTGQKLSARILADSANRQHAGVNLCIRAYGGDDRLRTISGPRAGISPGCSAILEWVVPDTGGQPIAEVGVELEGQPDESIVYLDWLTWDGMPDVTLGMPVEGGRVWRKAWVDSYSSNAWWQSQEFPFDIVQNGGVGMKTVGEFGWCDYSISTTAKVNLAKAVAIAVNVRGLSRYVAAVLEPSCVRLVERFDRQERVLSEKPFGWELHRPYQISMTTRSDGSVVSTVDGSLELECRVEPSRARGAVGLMVHEGYAQFGPVRIRPAL